MESHERTVEYIQKKEKETGKINKADRKYIAQYKKRIYKTKKIYGEFYTPDKVNKGHMCDDVFNNIINYGEDKVIKFSIDYNITKNKFKLNNNPIIFEIQDGMYEYLAKDNNIEKLYQLEDEINLYNQVRNFILSNVSSSYNKTQKINKLSDLKMEYLEQNKDISLLNNCLDIIKDEYYNTSRLYKAQLLLKKNIINIDTIELSEQIIKYSSF